MDVVITDNLKLSEVETAEQCATAEQALVEAIARIEGDLVDPTRETEWRRNATVALRVRRWALNQVQRRAAELRKPDKRVLHLLKTKHPQIYQELLREAA